MAQPVPFGRAMRNAHFNFDQNYTPLNHGAFGTYPTTVGQRLHTCQRAAEARPDTFIRYELPGELDSSRKVIASFLNIPSDEVVFIPNTTTGINVVLRSLRFERGDVIVYFSTIYGGCEKTVKFLEESTDVEGEKIDIQYPIADDEVVRRFEATLQMLKNKGKNPRVAIFDTISSLPGVQVPWERLVQSCKAYGVLSLVDGAHGIGHISLQHLGKVEPDFLASNCHKWLFVPRGCAIFYVPARNQRLIRSSLPTSHGFKPQTKPGQPEIFNPLPAGNQNDFIELFSFTATVDSSPYLCIKEALEFRREVCGGEERIAEYCSELAREGGKRAAAILETETLGNDEGTCFINVRLPLRVEEEGEIKKSDCILAIQWMAACLATDYHSFIGLYMHGNSFWARISCQIYLEMDDIIWGADILNKLCQRVLTGEHMKSKRAKPQL